MKNIVIENIGRAKNLACAAIFAFASFGVHAQAPYSECGEPTYGYTVNDSAVYYWWNDLTSEYVKRAEKVIPTGDASTFQEIKKPFTSFDCPNPPVSYGKDKEHVYFLGKVVEGADPATFSFFDLNYTKDKSHIFYEIKPISSRVDIFHHIDPNGATPYATDGENYYFKGITIKGKKFEFLPHSVFYARIDSKIFHDGKLVLGADAKTFVVISAGLKIAKDINHVFYDDKYIAGADPETFMLIAGSNGVFKDRHSVYFKGKKVSGLDSSTIKTSEFGFYLLTDRSVYAMLSLDKTSDEIRLLNDRDAKSFHELQPPLTLDKNGVYYEDKLILGADQLSFHSIDSSQSEDKNFRYGNGRIYCKFSKDTSDSFPICETPYEKM